MLGTPCAINSRHCRMHHSIPTSAASASVLHFTASATNSCGRSTLNVLGMTDNCDNFAERFDTGNNRYIDTFRTQTLYKGEILPVVVKQVGVTAYVCSGSLFSFSASRCLVLCWALLRVFRDSMPLRTRTGCTGCLMGDPSTKNATVEIVDLFLQFKGMAVASFFGGENGLVFCFIAPKHQ